jgi:AraC-like DNA-binding protein
VLNIIEKNLPNEDFSIDDLSKEMFLSRAQFHRKLKMLTGFSASPLIRTIRLEHAMQLLKANAGSVTDIAFRTGFNSQPYFTKCFTQHFGYSPKEVKSVG